jgi:hypothetical protein
LKFLLSTTLNDEEPELVRQNALAMLSSLATSTRDAVKVELAKHLQDRLGRKPLNDLHVRVAHAAGVLPYLRRAQRVSFFRNYIDDLQRVGYHWKSHASHGAILRRLGEYGGLASVPEGELGAIVKWMVLCHVGEPGGYGAGINRDVFYSNSAAPLIEQLFSQALDVSRDAVEELAEDRDVKRACSRGTGVARRFQELLDIVGA